MQSLKMTSLLVVAVFALNVASANDALDAKYPQLAELRIPRGELSKEITPTQLSHQPPHENLKSFEVTEDRTNFGVNGMTMPFLRHDRVSAFYMGTYHVQAGEGEPALFGIHAWQYKDEASAKSGVAEFSGTAVAMVLQATDSPAEARQALESMKYLRDGSLVVALIMEARASETSRVDFEKLVRSRLSAKHVEVPIDSSEVKVGGSLTSGKPPSFDENSSEMQRELAGIRKKWKNEYSTARSSQDRTTLGKELLAEAKRARSGSLQQFALALSTAMQGIEAADVGLSLTAFDLIDQNFQTDGEEARIRIATSACEKRTQTFPLDQQKLVLEICDRAIVLRQFYSAKVLLKSARLSSDPQTQRKVRLLQRRIEAEQSDSDRENTPEAAPTLVVEREGVAVSERQPGRAQRPMEERRPAVADNPFVLANGETVKLPAAFEDVIVGGSGRFLFFQMGAVKKLAVFDVHAQKIVYELPLEEADSRIAAGAEHLYIAVRRENVIQRWSLDGFEKELTVKLPFQSPVEAIATGSHATSVVYAGSADKTGVLLSPRTLKSANLKILDHTSRRPAESVPGADRAIVRASENGRTFCLLNTRYSPGDFRTLVVINGYVHSFRRGESVSYMAPNSAGELIYTPRGIFTDQAKEFRLSDGLRAGRFQMPSIGSSYSVSVDREDRKKEESATVNLHIGSAAEPILSLPDLTLRPGDYSDFHAQNRITLDRRVFFFSDANLLVTLPTSNDLLVLTELDVDAELKLTGEPYLHVVSRPQQYVKKSSRFEYQVEAKSSDDDLEYVLDSGPEGMRLVNGVVLWQVPRRAQEPFDVVITVKGSSGQETTHAFRLTVID